MSSVLRFLKQTPSNTFVVCTHDPAPAFPIADLAQQATAEGAIVTGNVALFPSQTALLAAVANASSGDYAEGLVLRDMGERLYWGVQGEDSEMVVFGLALDQSTTGSSFQAQYVLLQDKTNTNQCYISRGGF
jgi:hypothetical protein